MITCSIIVPMFNVEAHIENLFSTLDIFLDNKNYEIILIDDFSSDNTIKIVSQFIKNRAPSNLFFINNKKNFGPSYSRNIGVTKASGKFIAFLDSDDAWHHDKMDIQIKFMLENDISFSGTNHIILSNKKTSTKNKKNTKVRINYISFISALFKPPFATPSVIIEKKLINKHMFNNNLRYGEDYDLWLRILRHNNAVKLNNDLTFTFKHDYISANNSLSSNLHKMHKSNLYIFKELFSIEKKIYMKIIIILAYYFEFIKYYKRILIKFYLNKL